MTSLHPTLIAVTERIKARSAKTRSAYLAQVDWAMKQSKANPWRERLACPNVAHTVAGLPTQDKQCIINHSPKMPHLGIVSAYNDMLSAHQPLQHYPNEIKQAARILGATAQVAGGVPAMCDGVTQGYEGMELSLFSRDVIALSTVIALSHQVFDGMLLLGVCDKIVPGLLMGALQFGHLPAILVPAGPMATGLSNHEKAQVRQQFVQGKTSRVAWLHSEMKAYHQPGTCTFYGTANTNQMLMEIMGLHVAGASFVHPEDPLRPFLTHHAVACMLKMQAQGVGLADVVTEATLVNGMVGLLATGGSTNHTLHLPAMARMAGILLTWDDLHEIAKVVPLLVRMYPNGQADVNHFHSSGGMAYVISQLLEAGLLHDHVKTVMGEGLQPYTQQPVLKEGHLVWQSATFKPDPTILRPFNQPFDVEGGVRLLTGNLGRAVIKVSSVQSIHRRVRAPAKVFASQQAFLQQFQTEQLNEDMVAVLPYQGAKANGMPELHQLTPALSVLQDRGYQVALVTDGRMSGASGKVPAAIHVSPEALKGGALQWVQTGDWITLDADTGQLFWEIAEEELHRRQQQPTPSFEQPQGVGRGLFRQFREHCSDSEQGACAIFPET